eukprot:TRINITY_DN5576_c0_g1_i1.p1 TRINITY_DN5576_c0_g1~~TRINITY_DN5576_c0_g1_i1.p1  ORF type:complete len:598 (-),score=56.99 TRINITY_DN5576_c0_g1_i1:323-2116(-)
MEFVIAAGRQLLQTSYSDNNCPEYYGDTGTYLSGDIRVGSYNLCAEKVAECCYAASSNLEVDNCAYFNSDYVDPYHLQWPLALAAIVAMAMSYGIGANDSANSWGTTVGSRALPLSVAVMLGGFMEFLGAITLGYGVSKTIRKGVADPDDPDCWACGYCNAKMSLYMVAMLSALIAAMIFLLLATFTAMPVSTTHAIVGGVVGATISGVGAKCLHWSFGQGLGGIIASWVISPVLSGCIALVVYVILDFFVVRSKDPVGAAFIASPILYFVVMFVMLMLILLKSTVTKNMVEWKMVLIALAGGIVSAWIGGGIVLRYYTVPNFPSRAALSLGLSLELPEISDQIPKGETKVQEISLQDVEGVAEENGNGVTNIEPTLQRDNKPRKNKLMQWFSESQTEEQLGEDYINRQKELLKAEMDLSEGARDAIFTFRPMLVFIAALESFGHGANDTANATSAFTAVLQTYQKGNVECGVITTPVWVMAVAGMCVWLGVVTFGYRVIKTMGVNLVGINYMRGFCIELASTVTVVIATSLPFALPVSTTHCQVGAVVFVGMYAEGIRKVNWGLFGKIALSWVLTLPFAGLIAAYLTWVFGYAVSK